MERKWDRYIDHERFEHEGVEHDGASPREQIYSSRIDSILRERTTRIKRKEEKYQEAHH